MPHVGQEMLTLPGTPEFTPFGEFMIHPFIIYVLQNCQSKEYVYGLMTLILTALSWTYFIITIKDDNFLLTSRHLT